MTPAAQYAAAIEVLDLIENGTSAEQTLTTWARRNRYAGSKDRAALRDHVYSVLRRKRSVASLGGGTSGRALVLGLLRAQLRDPNEVFGAGGYGPPALEPEELIAPEPMTAAEAVDLPEWLWPMWRRDLGDNAQSAGRLQQDRACVFLRINRRRGSVADAQAALAADGIQTSQLDDVSCGLQVIENERKITHSNAFKSGLIEVQDAASQAAMLDLAVGLTGRVLDYCAGGGGKALALADLTDAQIVAHDVASERMADLPKRAARAGVAIAQAQTANLQQLAPFDAVLCDAPCSGSGTWRRTPDAKWRLTAERLAALTQIQAEVIRTGAKHVAQGGVLAYATCSVLQVENDDVVDGFLKENDQFQIVSRRRWLPAAAHDGFYLAVLRRA